MNKEKIIRKKKLIKIEKNYELIDIFYRIFFSFFKFIKSDL